MKILFLDMVCNKPYDPNVLLTQPLGGTEATVTRIAEGLAQTLDVTVAQHCRVALSMHTHKAQYVPLEIALRGTYTHIIVLRQSSIVPFVANKWPKAKIYLWCHDLAAKGLVRDFPALENLGVTTLAVSEFHKGNILDTYKQAWPERSEKVSLEVVYNPVDDGLKNEQTYYSKNKLTFFSSPHKGLDIALQLFGSLKYRNPKLELFIANPGYLESKIAEQPGVVNVGALPHPDAIEHVRNSFCVFYPNHIFPETFGLVFAEANAVGTPVLTHNLGAASEVLNPAYPQMVNCKDVKSVVDRFEDWYNHGRPAVEVKPQFRLKEVLCRWMQLIKK